MSCCICSYAMRLHCILNIEVYPGAWRLAAHSRGLWSEGALALALPLSLWNASCTPPATCQLLFCTTSRLQAL
jgi:hypothetical protein